MIIDVKFVESDSEIKCDFGELFEKPQKEVYDSGYTDGYEVGESDGYEKGNTDGYNKGYGEGETSGYNSGYTVGKTDGYSEGYTNGETAGYENGYNKGYDVGFDEGKESATTGANIDDLIDGSITEVYSEVETIRQYAFYQYSKLTKADFPLATSIEAYAFRGCTRLETAQFPCATTIDNYAFYQCVFTIFDCPVTLKIGTNVFAFSRIKSLILRSNVLCTLGSAATFQQTPIFKGTGYIYVPSALIDSYKSATNWSTYAAQFRALEDYTVDGTISGELDLEKIGA